MTLTELHEELSSLLAKGKGKYEVQALIDTPNEFHDGEVVAVNIMKAKKRIVLHIDQLPPPDEREED